MVLPPPPGQPKPKELAVKRANQRAVSRTTITALQPLGGDPPALRRVSRARRTWASTSSTTWKGRVPYRREARPARQHVELHRRAVRAGARIRGLPGAAGRGAGAKQAARAARPPELHAAAVPNRPDGGRGPRSRPTTRTWWRPRIGSTARGGGAVEIISELSGSCSAAPTRWPSSPATCVTC